MALGFLIDSRFIDTENGRFIDTFISVDKLTVDQMSFNELTIEELTVDELTWLYLKHPRVALNIV